jgi:hypothetical protein
MDYFKDRPLASSSIVHYNRKLTQWLSYMPQTHQHISQIFMFPEFSNNILLEKLDIKTNTNIHTFYSAILALLNHCTEYTSHIDTQQLNNIKSQWKKLLRDNLKPYEERRLNAIPTDNQIKKGGIYLKLNDIIAKRDSLPFGSIERLLLSFYTYIPPVRADYFATQIITFKESPKEPNYIRRISPQESWVIINDFKTQKTFKQIKNKLPPELNNELVESLRLKPRKYLFTNQTGQPFTRNSFTVWSKRVLSKLFETEMTLSIIRHLFINELTFDDKSTQEIMNISNKMGHDVLTHLKYRWDLTKINKDDNDSSEE